MQDKTHVTSEVAESIRRELEAIAKPETAALLKKFFKSGPGEYGQGDEFHGVVVPQSRRIAKKYATKAVIQSDIRSLLTSGYHEERLIGLLLLMSKFAKAQTEDEKKRIIKFYLSILYRVNNWDLVDISAPRLLGRYLFDKADRSIIYKLAASKNLWYRRVAILSTFYFISKNDFVDSQRIAKILLRSGEKHDLINKAIGWMLREIGKRDQRTEENFIWENYSVLSRTTLRYAIERFPQEKRRLFLQGWAHNLRST